MHTSVAVFLLGLIARSALAGTTVAPGGWRGWNNMHQMPANGSLLHDPEAHETHIIASNGTTLFSAPANSSEVPQQSGWITYASWLNTNSAPISSFKMTWTVPLAPKTFNGQTVFLFNSIEPSSGNAILQPVLQYGPSAAGGGQYWSVASWYVGPSGTYFTTLVRVKPGDVLHGVITLTKHLGNKYSYVSQFTNVPGTALSIVGIPQLTWATETTESYSVTEESDYPAGTTVFSGINLKLSGGKVPNVRWSVANDVQDGLTATVNTDGARSAKITVKY
ncbi:hypothetical protein FB45DRAFT_1061690 [Roridomyces roridus]|uniref:Concanavalin A-like lectin/glucanase n=1 Tax=Roridomyces roridus TaxID=1738132 RepID=A0AAD7FI88_9AGAR|nr:hypothetical protein FB45DRAFT_1061690 [Roridomyces roridus]